MGTLKVKVKVHTLDIAPLRSESPLQKRSGMARVLKGFHSFTCTSTRSSAIGMSHTCLCLPSYKPYSVIHSLNYKQTQKQDTDDAVYRPRCAQVDRSPAGDGAVRLAAGDDGLQDTVELQRQDHQL